jgi:hypothetical protein
MSVPYVAVSKLVSVRVSDGNADLLAVVQNSQYVPYVAVVRLLSLELHQVGYIHT